MRSKNRKVYLRVKTTHGTKKYMSSNIRSFSRRLLRLVNFHNRDFVSVYIKVSYGKQIDVFGKKINFYNDGTYTDEKEFNKAYQAFIEE